MAAVERWGVKFKGEYLISQDEVQQSNYRHEPEPLPRSGKEFCTVDGVEYYRYDCYLPQSPYGWYKA